MLPFRFGEAERDTERGAYRRMSAECCPLEMWVLSIRDMLSLHGLMSLVKWKYTQSKPSPTWCE